MSRAKAVQASLEAVAALPVSQLFVLFSTASYLLPAREAYVRKSPFFLTLFLSVLGLSFLMHCEELGACAPVSNLIERRLFSLNSSLSYYLLCIMLLIILEVRSEYLARIAMAAWALLIYIVDPNAEWPYTNFASAIFLALALLLIELNFTPSRQITAAYFSRLGVILAISGIGFFFFRLLHNWWVWHGVWHWFNSIACFLLLLAQRTKQENARKSGSGGSNRQGVDHKDKQKSDGNESSIGSSISSGLTSLTSPLKRGNIGGGGGAAQGGTFYENSTLIGGSGGGGSGGGGGTAPLLGGITGGINGRDNNNNTWQLQPV
jgi:hypothetical protein